MVELEADVFEFERWEGVPDWMKERPADLKLLCDFFVYTFGYTFGRAVGR